MNCCVRKFGHRHLKQIKKGPWALEQAVHGIGALHTVEIENNHAPSKLRMHSNKGDFFFYTHCIVA